MAFSNAQRLQSLGVANQLALELQRQIVANVGNRQRLMEVGMEPDEAKYVANSITTGPFVPAKACAIGMDTVLAPILGAMINA